MSATGVGVGIALRVLYLESCLIEVDDCTWSEVLWTMRLVLYVPPIIGVHDVGQVLTHLLSSTRAQSFVVGLASSPIFTYLSHIAEITQGAIVAFLYIDLG